jgi:hypothetical protein
MTQRFVYVARLQTGDEVELRRILEHLPDEALKAKGITEFSTYVGSGYCVLQFGMSSGDFQERFADFVNDPRVQEFHRKLAQHLVEGEQIAMSFAAGDARFHHIAGGEDASGGGPTVTSADLPLAAEVSRWPFVLD